MNKIIDDRRVAFVRISRKSFGPILFEKSIKEWKYILNGKKFNAPPKNVRVLEVIYTTKTDDFTVLVKSSDFPRVHNSDLVPEIEIVWKCE